MVLPDGVAKLGTFQGAQGNTGTFDEVKAVDLPTGSAAEATLIGPPENRSVIFGIPEGKPGRDGVNAVENDAAVAAYLANDLSDTQAEAISLIDMRATPVQKRVLGGVLPAPLRVPTLTVMDSWPNVTTTFNRMLWQENAGKVLYAFGSDSSLYKSSNSGATWVHKAYLNWAPFLFDAFLKTANGTLLTIDSAHRARRSVDDGATWEIVATFQAGWVPLGAQSWCIDKTTGDIYYGEYGTGTVVCNLWRSTDDGQTWSVFKAFPGSGTTDPLRIRHIHAVQWDEHDGRVWICAGDSTPGTGLWRVTADRTTVEPVITNSMLPEEAVDSPRSIGIMPFPDYVAWASDSTSNPFLFRMARTEIGKPAPVIEQIYRVNSTSWFTCKASADGSRWVFSSAQEGRGVTAIDLQVHVYAVEDQGATVYELVALSQMDDNLPAGSLQPLGLPEDQGDPFFLFARGTGRSAAWKLRMADSSGAMLAYPPALPVVTAWKTVNSGPMNIPASGMYLFHEDQAAAFARKLRIFDSNVRATDGSSGRLTIEVVDSISADVLYRNATSSERNATRTEHSPFIHEVLVTAGRRIQVRAKNVHTGLPVEGLVALTYGWAAP